MKKIIFWIMLVVLLMFAEYKFIMNNMEPYYADGYVFIEFMGQTERYYFETVE